MCQATAIDPAHGYTMMESSSGGGGPIVVVGSGGNGGGNGSGNNGGNGGGGMPISGNGEGFKKQPREFEFVFGCESNDCLSVCFVLFFL